MMSNDQFMRYPDLRFPITFTIITGQKRLGKLFTYIKLASWQKWAVLACDRKGYTTTKDNVWTWGKNIVTKNHTIQE